MARSYVVSHVPLEGQSEVIVTDARHGPAKFSIRLKNSNLEYLRMRSELESTALHPLAVTPDKGTPCIAVKSQKLYRGLVLSTDRDKNTSSVGLVDFGSIEALHHNMLFQIPDNIMAYPVFSSTVALTDGEALSLKPGLNGIFASLVQSLDHLVCEVVKDGTTHQTVNLYDVNKRQNIGEVVLRIFDNLAPNKPKAIIPAPPPIPKIETNSEALKQIVAQLEQMKPAIQPSITVSADAISAQVEPMTRGPVLRPAISQLCDPKFPLRLDGYDVYISYVKGPSQFWIQLKEDEQIIKDVADELAQHVEKGARRVERPEVGQLYTMESPDYGGYYRVRVGSVDGKMMYATFIDYGDAHPVLGGKVFSLPNRLRTLPPLSMRCSMRRQIWSLEAKKRFVAMTSDPASKVFRAVLQSEFGGIRVVDSLALDGQNIEQEIIAKNIHVPERSLIDDNCFPRTTAAANLFHPAINWKLKEHDVYISHSKSHTEFSIQFENDKDIIGQVAEAIVQHMKKAPPRVTRPVVGQIYVMEHPTLGGYFRARVSTITGDTIEAFFVDYGDTLPVLIEKIFVPSVSLASLPPLAACCRMISRDWPQNVKERFLSITSNSEDVFQVSFGPIVGRSVREVEALFLHGRSIEEYIFEQEMEVESFIQPSDIDWRDPVGHDVFVSSFNSPSTFYVQLKDDEDVLDSVQRELTKPLKKSKMPLIVGELYAVGEEAIGAFSRARIISVDETGAQVFFIDHGRSDHVVFEKIYALPMRLKMLLPLAFPCKMERQEWPLEEKNKFISIASNRDNVFRATFGEVDDFGVRCVHALFLDGKNIEDNENVGSASSLPPPSVTAFPVI